ncbi:hypothetical protein Rs2_34812 [Raphanus sativus]|nr:hypothetical protein Rs2_34812 [Raphanus sativus]
MENFQICFRNCPNSETLTGGNDWLTETAPPPPPGVKYGRIDSDYENLKGIGSKGLKHSVSLMSFNDTEFANKLNSKLTTSTTDFELSDVQTATSNTSKVTR